MRESVKLQQASCSAEGGRQLAGSTLNPPGNGSVCDVNVVIIVHGLLNDSNLQLTVSSVARLFPCKCTVPSSKAVCHTPNLPPVETQFCPVHVLLALCVDF